jgi:omega-amidase
LAALEDNQSGIIIKRLEKSPLDDFRKAFPAHLDADQFQLL